MIITEVEKLIGYYTDSNKKITISKNIFSSDNGRKIYNNIINKNICKNCFGIYVWVNSLTSEIVYIGMAGKIKTDGSIGDHSLRKRLKASRGKNKETRKDILTNDFIKNFMLKNNIDNLDFYIYYTKSDEAPSYLEAILIYKYFKHHKKLPVLNISF